MLAHFKCGGHTSPSQVAGQVRAKAADLAVATGSNMDHLLELVAVLSQVRVHKLHLLIVLPQRDQLGLLDESCRIWRRAAICKNI